MKNFAETTTGMKDGVFSALLNFEKLKLKIETITPNLAHFFIENGMKIMKLKNKN